MGEYLGTLLALLPPELHAIISHHREGPEDFPFTQEEIEWLLCRGKLSVLWSAQEVCLVERYTVAQRHKTTQAIANLRIGSCARAYFSPQGELVRKELAGNDRIHKEKLMKHLVGRCFIEQKTTGKTVISTFNQNILYADIVLLDVKSVYALLRRRFSSRDENSATKMATRSALKYIRDVTEKCSQFPPTKEMYLLENAAVIEEIRKA